jgi:hypothetical protein
MLNGHSVRLEKYLKLTPLPLFLPLTTHRFRMAELEVSAGDAALNLSDITMPECILEYTKTL